MSRITIHRHSESENRFRSYKILVNGKELGKIKNGKTVTLDLEPGIHELRLEIDWCCSNSIEFEIAEGEEIEFGVGGGSGSLFYRTIFKTNNYLQLVRNS